ncbi:MAG: DUF362 domain-containing protein [Dehalococcoidales bacterium]|nr:DUF362 domain-containing protein [Dehalococcoidales bacterium]
MKTENQNNVQAIVSIVKASRYNLTELIPAVRNSLELVGGLKSVVKPGNKVFVKINHLSPPSPVERGIVTHTVFVEAVLVLLQEIGVEITVGDDIEEGNEDGFKISGFRETCDRMGVRLVNLREAGFVERKCDGVVLKNIYVSRIVLEADVIINLPKFKTHSLVTFTGGVKNMYGIIPAGLRRRFHGEYLRTEDFCQTLVDIFSVAKPQLTVMDGIIAMEGEGPGSGQLRNMGLILASKDTVALDTVASRIIGLKPDDVLTTRYAGERGLGTNDLNKIAVAGESIDSVVVPDFKLPASFSRLAVNRAPRGLVKFAVGQISPRPRVQKKRCTACNECVKVCPTGAVAIVDKTARIDDKLCIRCMCCHEVCRYSAIVPRRPFVGNIVFGLASAVRKVVKM